MSDAFPRGFTMKRLIPALALLLLTGCPAEPAQVEAPRPATDGPGGAANRPPPAKDQAEQKLRAEKEARLKKEAEPEAAEEKAKADEAKRAQREAKEKAEQQAAEDSAEQLREGDLRILAGKVLFSFGKWATTLDEPNFVAVKMAIGAESRSHDKPITFGIGSVRSGMRSVFRDALPASWAKYEQNGWQGRLRLVTNDLLRARLGGDLFAKEPGSVNAAPLKKLFDLLYIAPDKPLFGTAAAQVYALVRQPVRDYTKAYTVMKPKKSAATKAYKAARAKHAASSGDKYSNDMMEWYYAQSDAYEIKDKLGMGNRRGAYLMSGFWMRRFADGTDAICFKFLRRVTKAYDPKWKP